jgi:osmotically-inducible protein OsmY
MKASKLCVALLTLIAFGALAGCSATSTKSADVADNAKSADVSASIRKSLDQAGLKDVSASNDPSKGVVTLAGQVELDREKSEAESIAKSIAGGQVVSNQIAVMGAGQCCGGRGRGRGPMGQGPGHMEEHGPDRVPERSK